MKVSSQPWATWPAILLGSTATASRDLEGEVLDPGVRRTQANNLMKLVYGPLLSILCGLVLRTPKSRSVPAVPGALHLSR